MFYSAMDTMTCELVKASLEESLESAYQKMQTHRIRHLPVIDDTNRIVGIISDRDIYKGAATSEGKVQDFMSWPVKTVSYDTDLRIVIRRMIAEKISAFLITYENRITGIVTSEDLLKLLHELLEDKFSGEMVLGQNKKSWIGSLLRIAE